MKASVEDRVFSKYHLTKQLSLPIALISIEIYCSISKKKALQSFSQNYSLNRRAIHQANIVCYCNRTLFLVTFYHAASQPP